MKVVVESHKNIASASAATPTDLLLNMNIDSSSASGNHHDEESDTSSLGNDNLSQGGGYSSSGQRSNSGASSSGDSSSEDPQTALENKKTAAVNRLRMLVIVVLVIASFGVSFTVFILSRKADQESFEIQYDGTVDKIFEVFTEVFDQIGAISGLGLDITAYSEDHNTTWPYQTISNIHGRGGNARTLSGALYISINHLVKDEDKDEWEKYVLNNQTNTWM